MTDRPTFPSPSDPQPGDPRPTDPTYPDPTPPDPTDPAPTPTTPIEQVVGAVPADPIAMLPARMETRFVGSDELRVRIFPDALNVHTHVDGIGREERDAGYQYWRNRLDIDPDIAWATLQRQMRAPRAAWVAEQTRPTNLATAKNGDQLDFPDPANHEAPWTEPPVAEALPAHWIVAGYRAGQRVYLGIGSAIPDRLAYGPAADPTVDGDPETQDQPEDDQTELPIDDGMRWLTDYDDAVANGMALTITAAEVGGGLAGGFDTLLALGVPRGSNAELAELLQAHRHTEGLALLRQGTTTNNTGSVPSGFDSTESDLAQSLDPARPDPTLDPASDAARLAEALAVTYGSALTDVLGANSTEFRNGGAMNGLLWETTWGYFLDNFLHPLVVDEHADAMRSHFVDLVRGRGPLPALRVGDQPYGVLPVVSGAHFQPEDGLETQLHRLLGTITGLWGHATGRSPFLAKSASVDADLLDVLEHTPHAESLRVRAVLGPAVAANTADLGSLGAAQEASTNWLAEMMFPGQRVVGAEMTMRPKSRSLPLPLVTSDELSETEQPTPNDLANLLLRLAREGATIEGIDSFAGRSVLAVLTRQTVLLTLAKAAARIVIEQRAGQIGFPIPDKIAPREPELHLVARTDESLADFLSADYSPTETVGQHLMGLVHTYLSNGGGLRDDPITAPIADLLDHLVHLSALPSAELHRLVAETLDLCSHRIDAWNTSLATKRLDAVRATEADRITIGAYGWLHDVKPETQPDSLGYIHAPSLGQATTAAILRSGHLANRGSGDDRFAIDLSSDRVRDALAILDAVREGRSLRALLGYRVERGLREHDLELAQYILDLRRYAPLRTSVGPDESEPLEALAARDVVDGLRLIERWDDRGRSIFGTGDTQVDIAANHQDGVAAVLHRISDQLDAVADVLLAEGIHHTVHGNPERAAAAFDALGRQGRPPDPEVVRTPRSSTGQTHRLVVALDDATPGAGWTSDRRSQAEPRLDAWVGRLLGDPGRFRFAAEVHDRSIDDPALQLRQVVECSLDELGISALSTVLAAGIGGGGPATELDERIAGLLTERITATGDQLELHILDDDRAVATWPDDTVGLAVLHTVAAAIRALISQARPASPEDFTDPNADPDDGSIDDAEHQARAAAATAALQAAAATVDHLVATRVEDLATLTDALAEAAAFGLGGILPAGDDDVYRQLERAKGELNRRLEAAIQATEPAAILAEVFSHGFVSLSLFDLPDPAALNGVLAQQSTLLDGDVLAPASWLQQLAPVRPGAAGLNTVLGNAEAIGAPTGPVDLDVVQVPHQAGDRWLALPLDDGRLPAASLGVVVHGPGGFDPSVPQAGLVIDEWNEAVPDPVETTGLSFHYDAPGTRAPQSVLLAVPADRQASNWSLDELLSTLSETLSMAQIRAVDPQRLWMMSSALPAVYLAANSRGEGISTSLYQAVSAQSLG